MSKNNVKNKNIERIRKLISTGKTNEVFLELAKVDNVGYLFQVGLLLTQNGIHDAGERIFDKICKLKPDYEEAWYNKGVTLGKLGKPDEVIICYNEVIKLKPDYEEA